MDGAPHLEMSGKRPHSLHLAAKLRPSSSAPPPPPPRRRISLYHPSLLPLQTCKSMRELLQVQAHLTATGLFSDPFAASRVLKSSASAAPLHYTLLLLSHIPCPDAFSVNTALAAAASSPDPRAALTLFSHMLRAGFTPNSFTFPPLFKACSHAPSLGGDTCHAQALKRGACTTIPVCNALLHMYGDSGRVDRARALFDGMPDRDVVTWNSMVDGYLKSGDLSTARELFDRMPDRNVVSWNVMIGGYLRERRPGRGLKLFREMGEEGPRGNETMMVSVVTACGRLRRLREGTSVHGYFVRHFADENLIFGTALVDMYSRCGRVDVAQRVFDGMSERNVVCWNAMVLGHCIHGVPEDGLLFFDKMVGGGERSEDRRVNESSKTKQKGIRPDEVTFVGVLCACARAGLLAEGKLYFNQITNLYNLTPNFAHYWCMANLYGGLGLVQEAEDVLRGMPEETDSLLLSSLLGLCRFRGDIQLGERIAKQLIELEPLNCSRYALLWNVYASAGQWEDAHKVKEMMKERGVRVMPGYSLFDLKEIVHNFKVTDWSRPEIEKIYMDDVSATLSRQGLWWTS